MSSIRAAGLTECHICHLQSLTLSCLSFTWLNIDLQELQAGKKTREGMRQGKPSSRKSGISYKRFCYGASTVAAASSKAPAAWARKCWIGILPQLQMQHLTCATYSGHTTLCASCVCRIEARTPGFLKTSPIIIIRLTSRHQGVVSRPVSH